jgi:hypothetical protein
MPRAHNGKQNREKLRAARRLADVLPITASFRLADAAQVDFGAGPALIHESGHALKTWFFVMTMLDAPTVRRTRVRSDRRAVADLSPARLRVVRLLPGRIIVDNAMCAIIRACMYDPEVQRSYAGLAEGYGFRTCPPHDPQKKSVFESGVKYIKKSFMPLRTLRDLPDANRQLREWIMQEASVREDGTKREQPLARSPSRSRC